MGEESARKSWLGECGVSTMAAKLEEGIIVKALELAIRTYVRAKEERHRVIARNGVRGKGCRWKSRVFHLEEFTWKRDTLGSETALQPYWAKQCTFYFLLAI